MKGGDSGIIKFCCYYIIFKTNFLIGEKIKWWIRRFYNINTYIENCNYIQILKTEEE